MKYACTGSFSEIQALDFFFYPKFFEIESKKCKDIQEGKSYEPIDASVHHIAFDEAIETGIILSLDQVVAVIFVNKQMSLVFRF